jgi:putative copper export protein
MSTTNAVLAGPAVFSSTTKTAYVIARDLEYLCGALFWGGLAFVSALWPEGASVRRTRAMLAAAWATGTAASAAALALEGAWITQRGPGAAFRGDVVRGVLRTEFGRAWAAKCLLWALALVLLAEVLRTGAAVVRGLAWRVGALAVGLATLRIDGLTGHASDTPRKLVAELADLVHLVAISVWLGGLAVLVIGVLPRRDVDELARIVPRYSTLAMVSVTAVVASGAVMTWRLLDSAGQLTATTWGHLLLLKLALLAIVLAAAFGSKTWVAHRLDFAVILRGDRALVRPFVVSVAAETAIVLCVLAVAGFLATADVGR